jgi:hypothetical protein
LFTGVNDNSDKFFAGLIDTAEQLITGVINSRISPRIFEKIQKDSNGMLGGLGAEVGIDTCK